MILVEVLELSKKSVTHKSQQTSVNVLYAIKDTIQTDGIEAFTFLTDGIYRKILPTGQHTVGNRQTYSLIGNKVHRINGEDRIQKKIRTNVRNIIDEDIPIH